MANLGTIARGAGESTGSANRTSQGVSAINVQVVWGEKIAVNNPWPTPGASRPIVKTNSTRVVVK